MFNLNFFLETLGIVLLCYSYLLQYPTNAEGTIVELRSFKLVRIGRFLEIPSVFSFRWREKLNTGFEFQHHFRYARAWEG